MTRPKSPRPPTIRDIAAAASVAPSTVSRVFTRPDLISEATVARVTVIAQQLGYAPNHMARSLSTGKRETVALLVPDIANPFFPPLIKSIERFFQERQVAVLLAETDEEPDLEANLARTFRGRADGLIIASPRSDTENLRRLAGSLPLVLVNREVPGANRVLIATAAAMRDAVAHLTDLGHRHIAYLAGPVQSWSNGERRTAIQAAAADRAVALSVLQSHKPDYDSGRKAAGELLASGATAVIAYDDILAHGLMAELSERGFDVPTDMSVIGCDDLVAPVTVPPMTSIRSSLAVAGELAARQMESLMTRGRSPQHGDILVDVVESTLQIRMTTAHPRD